MRRQGRRPKAVSQIAGVAISSHVRTSPWLHARAHRSTEWRSAERRLPKSNGALEHSTVLSQVLLSGCGGTDPPITLHTQ
jgi:hypothetical protein